MFSGIFTKVDIKQNLSKFWIMVYQKLLRKSLCLYNMIEISIYTMKGISSEVEQSLSIWQVMGSTPLSGSILFQLVIVSEEILVIHFQI